MELTTEGRPSFSPGAVRKIVKELYGIEGAPEPLPAEWDQNFRLDGGEAGTFVVKIANRADSTEVLELEALAVSSGDERNGPKSTLDRPLTIVPCFAHETDETPSPSSRSCGPEGRVMV